MAKLTQCPNGHFYDMERSPQCPYCGQSEAQPPVPPVGGADVDKTVPLDQDFTLPELLGRMVRCSKGHAYDLRKSSHCPFCEQGVPGPPDRWVRCPNGHFYDLSKSSSCPYCDDQNTADIPPTDGTDVGKTVPLREKTAGQTVPLQEEVMNKTQPLNDVGMDRTQPLYDAGTDRTRPLDEAPITPPPLRHEAGWQRMLLLVAAGLAAVSTLLALIDMMRWL